MRCGFGHLAQGSAEWSFLERAPYAARTMVDSISSRSSTPSRTSTASSSSSTTSSKPTSSPQPSSRDDFRAPPSTPVTREKVLGPPSFMTVRGNEKTGLQAGALGDSLKAAGNVDVASKTFGPVKVSISAKTSVVTDLATTDGVTRFSVKSDASVSASVAVKAGVAAGKASATDGVRANYEVSMPAAAASQVDPASVNPFDPKSMPVGTTVTLSGEAYGGTALEASFKNLSASTKVESAAGVSVAVTRTGENTVRVTAGPTGSQSLRDGVGVNVGLASVELSRTDKLRDETLKTAEFDLSTPEGKQGYEDFLGAGVVPTQNGPGVSGVATVERKVYSSVSELGGKFAGLGVSAQLGESGATAVTTTRPDGSSTRVVDMHVSGGLPAHVTQSFDASGAEQPGSREYAYQVKVENETAAVELGLALGASGLKPGDTVTMTFDEKQLAAFRERVQQKAVDSFGGPAFPQSDSPDAFAAALVQDRTGTMETATRLFGLADGGQGFTPIDARVTVE